MGAMAYMLGGVALIFAMAALHRIRNLEKKLKQFDVIPHDFDSRKDGKEVESE